MTLGEFIKKRKEDLKLKWKDFEDAGVSSQTISCIINNKQKSIMPATREKLATVLKCSQGDIQACIAETPNPLRKEAAKPEGVHPTKTVPVKQYEPAPEKMLIPEHLADVNVEIYKSHLRDLLVQRITQTQMSASVADVYADFGWMVAQELS